MTVALAAADAQVYWISAKIPNDQFLLYAFRGEPADLEEAVAQVVRRARHCSDLALRVDDGCALTYPDWVRSDVTHDQVLVYGPAADWQHCLDAVVALAGLQHGAAFVDSFRQWFLSINVFASLACQDRR